MSERGSHILDTKAGHFDPSKFKDEYEDALKTLVRRKAAGKPVKVAEREERPDNVVSLMDALQQSLKGKASVKRSAHSRARRVTHRPAKKAHRAASQGKLRAFSDWIDRELVIPRCAMAHRGCAPWR